MRTFGRDSELYFRSNTVNPNLFFNKLNGGLLFGFYGSSAQQLVKKLVIMRLVAVIWCERAWLTGTTNEHRLGE
jgi:hypothetical protein